MKPTPNNTPILQDLRALLARYTEPCLEVCDHSQCPLLREIQTVIVTHSLEKARLTVKPIVDLERTGESVGGLMSMHLRRDGILDLDFDPFRRSRNHAHGEA